MAVVSASGKIPQLSIKFWKELPPHIRKWVYLDCTKGKMQDNSSGHRLSEPYQTYKANDMKRFSDGKRLGSARRLANGATKTYKTGKHPVVGRSLITEGVPKVTMLLTGDLVKGLHGTKVNKNGVTVEFLPRDRDKLKSPDNRRYIVGLSTKNRAKVKDLIIKEFIKNKQKFLPKNITINVG